MTILEKRQLKQAVFELRNMSDAYIEATLYGKLAHKYSIKEIREAIEEYHKEP